MYTETQLVCVLAPRLMHVSIASACAHEKPAFITTLVLLVRHCTFMHLCGPNQRVGSVNL